MCYEVITPPDEERGVMFDNLAASIEHARLYGGEVWRLADDEAQTRVRRVWPEPELQAAERAEREHEASAVDVARARRVATELLAAFPVSGYEQTHALVALAYARGSHDAWAQVLSATDQLAAELVEAIRS